MPQNSQRKRIVPLAKSFHVPPYPSLILEPDFFVRTQRSRVIGKRGKRDAVQIPFVEPKIEQDAQPSLP